MPIYTLSDLRRTAPKEYQGLSDSDLVLEYSKRVGADPVALADRFGVGPTGVWNAKGSAGVDAAQASLYGVGEAVADSLDMPGVASAMRQRRESNQYLADVGSARAKAGGIPDRSEDVDGIGSGLRYVGGLALQTAPQMAAVAGASLVGGLPGAAAAGYTFALGDTLENQRDQAGRTDLGSAALAAVPYAAVDTLTGVGGKIVSRLGRPAAAAARVASEAPPPSTLARMGREAGKTALTEGAGESFQETMNQAARMGVDPSATFTDPEALDRYAESFVGGAALGGLTGGVAGALPARRGLQPPPAPAVDDKPSTDLLEVPQAEPLRLGFSGYDTGVGELVTAPDGTTMTRAEFEARRSGMLPAVQGERGLSRGFSPVDEVGEGAGVRFDPITQNLLEGPAQQVTTQDLAAPGVLYATSNGTIAPAEQLSGQQYDMFGGPDVFESPAPAPQAAQPAPAVDGLTPDLFDATPTAMVRTQFNPAQEPAYPMVGQRAGAAKETSPRGAVAGSILSRIKQYAGEAADPTMAIKMAGELSGSIGDYTSSAAKIEAARIAVEKNIKKLDAKVSDGSDMLTPEEYAAQRDKLDSKLMAIMAAEQLVNEVHADTIRAYAEEAKARQATAPQQGAMVGEDLYALQADATQELVARKTDKARKQQAKQAENEAVQFQNRVLDEAQREREQERRSKLLSSVFDNQNVKDTTKALEQLLRRSGYPDAKLTQAERDRISDFERVRSAFGQRAKAAAEAPALAPAEATDAAQAPAAKAEVTQRAPKAVAEEGAGGSRPTPAAPAHVPAPAPAATKPPPAPTAPKQPSRSKKGGFAGLLDAGVERLAEVRRLVQERGAGERTARGDASTMTSKGYIDGMTASDYLDTADADLAMLRADIEQAERVGKNVSDDVMEELVAIDRNIELARALAMREDANLAEKVGLPEQLVAGGYKALKGVEVGVKVELVGGGEAEFRYDAAQAMKTLDEREEAVRKLRACLEGAR